MDFLNFKIQNIIVIFLLLAEVVNDGLEDQHWSGAAEDGERLPGEEAVDDPDDEAGHEGLHAGHAVPGGVAQEASERYDRCQAGDVDEEVGGHALQRDGVFEVGQEPGFLPLDVVPQTSEQPPSPDQAGVLPQLGLLLLLVPRVRGGLVRMFPPLL